MQRFTISIDDQLAEQFDQLIARRGYENRSEAVRDLIRLHLTHETSVAAQGAWCMASVSFVYDHHNAPATTRVLDIQHAHHNLVVSSIHTHIDHDNCLETVVLRGPLQEVKTFAKKLTALRGVRHGNIHLIPLSVERSDQHGHASAEHSHAHDHDAGHVHYKPHS